MEPTVGHIRIPPAGPGLREARPKPSERTLFTAESPWIRVGGTYVRSSAVRSIITQYPWNQPPGSIINPDEIREDPIPKSHQALSGQFRPLPLTGISASEGPGKMDRFQSIESKSFDIPSAYTGRPENIGSRSRFRDIRGESYQAPSGQFHPSLQTGISASEGPREMDRFQNVWSKSFDIPSAYTGRLENIRSRSRERDIRAEVQFRANSGLSPQKNPREYACFRDAQGNNGEGRLAHVKAKSPSFQNNFSWKKPREYDCFGDGQGYNREGRSAHVKAKSRSLQKNSSRKNKAADYGRLQSPVRIFLIHPN